MYVHHRPSNLRRPIRNRLGQAQQDHHDFLKKKKQDHHEHEEGNKNSTPDGLNRRGGTFAWHQLELRDVWMGIGTGKEKWIGIKRWGMGWRYAYTHVWLILGEG